MPKKNQDQLADKLITSKYNFDELNHFMIVRIILFTLESLIPYLINVCFFTSDTVCLYIFERINDYLF